MVSTNDICIENTFTLESNTNLSIFTENEFVQALVGGRLALVIITASWCDKCNIMIDQAKQAAAMLDDFFATNDDDGNYLNSIFDGVHLDPTVQLSKPLIGIMDSETVPPMLIESLGGVTSYPAIKCVLTFPDNSPNDADSSKETESDEGIVMWDYIGQRESAEDLYESVLMYWYRFVLSNAIKGHHNTAGSDAPRSPIFTFESLNQLESFLQSHGERLLRPSHPRMRYQTKNTLLSQVFDFYMGGKHRKFSGVLHRNFESENCGMNQQCKNTQQGSAHSDDVQEVDPYILLIQCRSAVTETQHLTKSELNAHLEFDELAEEMTHRKDVAFFSLLDESVCGQWLQEAEESTYGAVAVFRARRFVSYSTINTNEQNDAEVAEESSQRVTRVIHSIATNWHDALQSPPHAIYDPIMNAEMPSDGKRVKMNIVEDPMEASEYVQSKMIPFVVTQTTPTVLWFDRYRTTQLAFPWYRKVHAALVVDAGLSHQVQNASPNSSHPNYYLNEADVIEEPIWPSKLNRSVAATDVFKVQQKAIQSFYNAALDHRIKRPYDDVVFLIVPSSETRILTKFGIDIWSHLDEAAFPNQNSDEASTAGSCTSSSAASVLPIMILTDSSGNRANRYYMCSGDISSVHTHNGGAIAEYIDTFFSGTIDEPFVRSEPSTNAPWQSNKNQANVTVLTGNNFESLVMEREDSHSMLLFQTITCGHCKRFSVLWNEFSSLVQAMNWGEHIEVMKVDLSKNDIVHDQVDVWDVPAVYYFPAGEKQHPIEVTWIGPKRNPQYDYDEGLSWIRSGADLVEWIIRQGKLDIELLIGLDELKNKPTS